MRFLLLAGLGGCVTSAECDARTATAQAAGEADGLACALRPRALEHLDCGSADRTPELTYYAAWCGRAAVSCIEGDTDAQEVCWGAL